MLSASAVRAQEPPPPAYQPAGYPAQLALSLEQAADERMLAKRLRHRMSGRLSLDFNFGIAGFKQQENAGDPFPFVRVLVGYRKHVSPRLGIHLRGGPMLGIPWRTTSGDPGPSGSKTDSTTLTGGSLDGLLLLGPFGTFFVGPVVCLDYVYLTDTTLNKVYPPVTLHNGITAGGGFNFGLILGSREQVSLYQSLRITYGQGESMLSLLFGIGFVR
jgi:hypothetical protein